MDEKSSHCLLSGRPHICSLHVTWVFLLCRFVSHFLKQNWTVHLETWNPSNQICRTFWVCVCECERIGSVPVPPSRTWDQGYQHPSMMHLWSVLSFLFPSLSCHITLCMKHTLVSMTLNSYGSRVLGYENSFYLLFICASFLSSACHKWLFTLYFILIGWGKALIRLGRS